MQTVSSAFVAEANSPIRDVAAGVLVSWLKEINPSYDFFTINVSLIGGPDLIKGAGGDVTFFDKFDYISESDTLIGFDVEQDIGRDPWGILVSQADVTLDNTGNRYIPGFDDTIGDYIVPRRPIKLAVGFGGELVNQITGLSDDPESELLDRRTKIHLMDGMEDLLSYESATLLQTDKTSKEIIETLLQEAGLDSTQYDIENSLNDPIGYVIPYGLSIGETIEKLVEAEAGYLFLDEDGKVHFWNRQHLPFNTDARARFTYDNLEDIKFVSTPIINDVTITAKPRELRSSQEVYYSAQSVEIEAGSTREVVATFKDENGDLPVTTVTLPVHVDVDNTASFYDTNEASDGSGATSQANIVLASVDLVGTSYVMTFQNVGTVKMYVTTIRIVGTPAKVREVIKEQHIDQTSIDTYGRNPNNSGNTIVINNDLIQLPGGAQVLAQALVQNYKDPRRRLVIKPFAMPHLQFGDAVEVDVTDNGELVTAFVLGRKIGVDVEGDLYQELVVEQRPDVDYFTINVSTINGPDVLAP